MKKSDSAKPYSRTAQYGVGVDSSRGRVLGQEPSGSVAGKREREGGNPRGFEPTRGFGYARPIRGPSDLLPRDGVTVIQTQNGTIAEKAVFSRAQPRAEDYVVEVGRRGAGFVVRPAEPSFRPTRSKRSSSATTRPRGVVEEPARTIRRAHYLMARRAFPTDSALADAVGVHRSQVFRWKEGEPASHEHSCILRDLAFVVETLAESLEPSTMQAWLTGRSPELGGESPLEAIHGGRAADVLMAFQAQSSGAYY